MKAAFMHSLKERRTAPRVSPTLFFTSAWLNLSRKDFLLTTKKNALPKKAQTAFY